MPYVTRTFRLSSVVLLPREVKVRIPARCPSCKAPLEDGELSVRTLEEKVFEGDVPLEVDVIRDLDNASEKPGPGFSRIYEVMTSCCHHSLTSVGFSDFGLFAAPRDGRVQEASCVVDVKGVPQAWRVKATGRKVTLEMVSHGAWEYVCSGSWNGQRLTATVLPSVKAALSQALRGKAALEVLEK